RRRSVARQQRLDVGRRDRGAAQETLVPVASHELQKSELFGRFDALGDYLEPQLVGQRDDRTHDGYVTGIEIQVADEAAVDLELIDRKSLQVAHTGVPGAEVVDRHNDAKLAQLLQHHHRLLG